MISKHNYLQSKLLVNKLLTCFELMGQELEALKEAQSGPNPMDFSITDNEDLNREHNRVEQEKHKTGGRIKKN